MCVFLLASLFFVFLLHLFVEKSGNHMVKHVLQHHLCCFVDQVSDLQRSATSTDDWPLLYASQLYPFAYIVISYPEGTDKQMKCV